VPAVAGALLLAFELLLVYKLWLATKAFDREMASLPTPPEATGARVGHGPHDPAALPVTP
jgi:hypothetical protein